MTYREWYQKLHPGENAADIHLDLCPDSFINGIPGFRCPFPDVDPIPDGCRDCWDSEIPATKEADPNGAV